MEPGEPEGSESVHHVPRTQLSREDGGLGGVLLEDMDRLEVPQEGDLISPTDESWDAE